MGFLNGSYSRMATPPRPIKFEQIGIQDQRKRNKMPTDPDLLTTQKLWEFDPTKVPPPRPSTNAPWNWSKTRKGKSKKTRKSRKCKKTRRV